MPSPRKRVLNPLKRLSLLRLLSLLKQLSLTGSMGLLSLLRRLSRSLPPTRPVGPRATRRVAAGTQAPGPPAEPRCGSAGWHAPLGRVI